MKILKRSLKPQQIDENIWYYETEKSIEVHIKVFEYFAPIKIEIPRLKLLNSLSRIYGVNFREYEKNIRRVKGVTNRKK